jgi:hypothetical protein
VGKGKGKGKEVGVRREKESHASLLTKGLSRRMREKARRKGEKELVPRAGFEPARAYRPLAPEASASAKFRHRGERRD